MSRAPLRVKCIAATQQTLRTRRHAIRTRSLEQIGILTDAIAPESPAPHSTAATHSPRGSSLARQLHVVLALASAREQVRPALRDSGDTSRSTTRGAGIEYAACNSLVRLQALRRVIDADVGGAPQGERVWARRTSSEAELSALATAAIEATVSLCTTVVATHERLATNGHTVADAGIPRAPRLLPREPLGTSLDIFRDATECEARGTCAAAGELAHSVIDAVLERFEVMRHVPSSEMEIDALWVRATKLAVALPPHDLLGAQLLLQAALATHALMGAGKQSCQKIVTEARVVCAKLPELAPRLFLALVEALCVGGTATADQFRVAMAIPGSIFECVAMSFCSATALQLFGERDSTPSQQCWKGCFVRSTRIVGHRHDGFSPLRQRRVSSFTPLWDLVIEEIVHYGQAIASTTDGGDEAAGVAAQSEVGKRMEHILRACGRMIGSLRRHNRLDAVAELHDRLSSITEIILREPLRVRGLSSVAPHCMVLPLSQRVRQSALFDAYALITMGHVAESTRDISSVSASHARLLLHSCSVALRHIRRQSESGLNTRRVDPDAEKDQLLLTRLGEGTRLATKLLLKLDDVEGICQLYEECPEMGPCWEVGVAYNRRKENRAALRVYSAFLESTRTHFGPMGLPFFLRERLLETLRATARDALLASARGNLPAKALEEGANTAVLSDPVSAADAAAAIMEIYAMARKWRCTFHSSFALTHLLRAVAELSPEDLSGMSAPHDGWLRPKMETAHEREPSGFPPKVRNWQYNVAAHFALAHCTAYACDGFPIASVDIILDLFKEAGTTAFGENDGDDCSIRPDLSISTVIFVLQRTHPQLPVTRSALAFFVKQKEWKNVSQLLRMTIADRNPSGTLAILQELPMPALEALWGAIVEPNERFPCSDGKSEAAFPQELGSDGAPPTATVDVIEAAIDCRQRSDSQRGAWRCYYCSIWNGKHSRACVVCGALDMAVWVCPPCGAFNPTTSRACLVCSHPPGGSGALHDGQFGGAQIVPLRKWRCDRCSRENDATHAFYCKGCGGLRPMVQSLLTASAFTCDDCGARNPHGGLRPWCGRCGKLLPKVSALCKAPQLWGCVECREWSPWLSANCLTCGSGTKPISGAPGSTIPWFRWRCPSCKLSNAAWAPVCWSCGHERGGDSVLSKTPTASSTAGASELTEVQACKACRLPLAVGERVCAYCSVVQPQQRELPCAKDAPTTIYTSMWLCLRSDCLQVNTIHAESQGGQTCRGCGKEQGLTAALSFHSNPLGYTKPPQCSIIGVKPSIGSRLSELNQARLPAALQLPVPVCVARCEGCDAPLEAANVARVCRLCKRCSMEITMQEVSVRLLLHEAAAAMKGMSSGAAPSDDALTLMRSAAERLRSVPEEKLPWQGKDLLKGMQCGIAQRYPLLPDDQVHSTVEGVAALILRCSQAAKAGASAPEGPSTKEGDRTSCPDVLRHSVSRSWLCVALDLVDCVNRSTDYDELGFDVLEELCLTIRPSQSDHIRRETRWVYLSEMKLTREAIVNDVACPYCLQPPHRSTDAVERCRDGMLSKVSRAGSRDSPEQS